MLKLGIHRSQVLQEELDGIDLLLAADRGSVLGGRRNHEGEEWG